MTDDLDTLRPEIREAVAAIDKGNGVFVNGDDCDGGIAWATVRVELLRLADENADLHKSALVGYEDGWHALRNERDALKAELAALKARIADAQIGTVVLDERETQIISCDLPEGTRVALVKVED